MNGWALTAAVGAASVAGAAQGAFMGYEQGGYTLDRDARVSVEFVRSSAGARGSLYHTGVVSGDAWRGAGDGLGLELFSNHGTAGGTSVDLGAFAAGESLHFAYEIVRGAGGARTGDVFRTDVADDGPYFAALESGALRTVFGVEDIRDPKRSDWDNNDVVFAVNLAPIESSRGVPAPGPVSIAAMAGALALSRRRGRVGSDGVSLRRG